MPRFVRERSNRYQTGSLFHTRPQPRRNKEIELLSEKKDHMQFLYPRYSHDYNVFIQYGTGCPEMDAYHSIVPMGC